MATKQQTMLMNTHGGRRKPARRIALLVGVTAASLVIATPAVQSSERAFAPPKSLITSVKHASPGKVHPCVPPQASRMEPRVKAPHTEPRPQRNAGDPSLSYAMVLSMALGLRSVAGPVEHMERTRAVKTEPLGTSAGTKRIRPDRYALSDRPSA